MEGEFYVMKRCYGHHLTGGGGVEGCRTMNSYVDYREGCCYEGLRSHRVGPPNASYCRYLTLTVNSGFSLDPLALPGRCDQFYHTVIYIYIYTSIYIYIYTLLFRQAIIEDQVRSQLSTWDLWWTE